MTKSNLIVVVAIVWGIVGLLALVPAGLSVMVFDAPGSETQPGTVWLFRAMMSFPFVCFAVAIAAAIFNVFEKPRLAIGVLLQPLIDLAIGVAALIVIDRIQGGRFGG